ncbi:pre-mRNA 3'-end-processing factor FIP1 isoform X4 [Archocentrus centrarchus]|uniref:pre-mRNA 3'-end-processing factor FIP1 isoform X4 n=1 Tax=Archocentrus centrarchus TaxID=63155 RepID=UPI0011EA3FFA|nr:pre-mRNA 3'-end-processing factor FIP1 isoform X4 [Archocentrus centrarchus]
MAITSIPRATVTVRVYGMDTTDDKEETQRVEIPSSSGHTSEHLRRTRHAGGTTEDPELENIQGNEKMNQNVELLEKKPWRKAGANISDYFNYGFDEKSWNAYRRKQAELHGLKRKENAKNRGQKRQTGYREEGTSCAYSSPGTPSILAFRESDPTADLIGGQPESSRQHWHQYLNDGVSNIQVFCEDYNEDNINADQLPPPVNMNSLFEFIPPSFLFHPGPQPPFPTATLVSGNSKGFDNPATSLYPCPSRRITISPGVIDATKAWECYILQEKRNEDRDRSREHGHDRNSKRSGYKEKESCFSSRCRRSKGSTGMLGSEGTSIADLKEAVEKRGGETKTRDHEKHQKAVSAAADVAEMLVGTRRIDVSTKKPREVGRTRKTAGWSLLTEKGN